eukprot:78771_1
MNIKRLKNRQLEHIILNLHLYYKIITIILLFITRNFINKSNYYIKLILFLFFLYNNNLYTHFRIYIYNVFNIFYNINSTMTSKNNIKRHNTPISSSTKAKASKPIKSNKLNKRKTENKKERTKSTTNDFSSIKGNSAQIQTTNSVTTRIKDKKGKLSKINKQSIELTKQKQQEQAMIDKYAIKDNNKINHNNITTKTTTIY